MKFEIRPALPEEIDASSVWVSYPDVVPNRTTVKITNPSSRRTFTHPLGHRTIYCEALAIDSNFVNRYNSRMEKDYPEMTLNVGPGDYDDERRLLLDGQGRARLFINAYYRARLDDLPRGECDLDFSRIDNFWGHTWASLQHPQVSVRIATKLGLLALLLGVVGAALGGMGLWLVGSHVPSH